MRALLPLLPALLLACAPPAPPGESLAESPAPAAAAPAPEIARVLALRPLPPPEPARERLAAQLLRVAAGPDSGAGPLALEVLVRLERTGRDLALLIEADPRLRVGDRVALTPEARPRLRRLDGA
ncbi:hypothetical protein [Rubritepida flocculans]|jgi:hypothetical protein|uniref:hypothetical protein n=1 Tax=Rubritepida flocculans TaxID=182403 RepID=UPI0004046A13